MDRPASESNGWMNIPALERVTDGWMNIPALESNRWMDEYICSRLRVIEMADEQKCGRGLQSWVDEWTCSRVIDGWMNRHAAQYNREMDG